MPENNESGETNNNPVCDNSSENNLDKSDSTKEQSVSLDLISSSIAQCQLALSDLQLSAELIENAVKDGDLEVIQLELDDLDNISTRYSNAYVNILEHCDKEKLPTYESHRRKFLLLFKSTKSQAMKMLPKSSTYTKKENIESPETLLKLPKVDVIPFTGDKDDWNLFKGTFITYIHENKKMLDIEKFRFLKSKLKGTPLSLIDAIPMEGKFYENAWKIIETHYDDPLKRISRHLDAMFTNTPIKKVNLRTLVTQFRSHMTALQVTFQERPDIDVLSQFGIHGFLLRADKGARLDWQREMEKTKRFASFDEFINFMDGRCNAYERAVGESDKTGLSSKQNLNSFSSKGASLIVKAKKPISCYYCSKDHIIQKCEEFTKLSPENRLTFVNKKRLCRRCLRGKCFGSCDIKCSICQRFHHSLIHVEKLVNKRPIIQTNASNGESFFLQQTNSSNCNNIMAFNNSINKFDYLKTSLLFDNYSYSTGWVGLNANEKIYTLLATAIVEIINGAAHNLSGRALIDPGSQFNFITKKFVSQLNLRPFTVSYEIQGIDNLRTFINKAVNLKIKSRVSDYTFTLKCLILENIVDDIPNQYFSIDHWEFPKYLNLADPQFNIPNKVDLLLGGAIFWKILKPNLYKKEVIVPRIFASHLGWLVAGEINLNVEIEDHYNFSVLSTEAVINLSKCIERLWLLEDYTDKNNWSFEEIECERIYVETTKRDNDGCFHIDLPFKIPQNKLGLSKAIALKRFYALERRLIRDPQLQVAYIDNIEDYIMKKHIIEIDDSIDTANITYYLPHHPIIKKSSTSTRVRSVFDASAPPYNGLSLNQCLMVGPTVQSDLISILMRSRIYKYIFTADITQMYRQIKVNKEQTSLLRIFWRKDPSEPLKVYEHKTLPFGLASAPYLATRCLKKLAEDDGDKFPLAKSILLRDFYVDDVITGSNSLKDVLQIRNQLLEILKGGGFQLNKWCANSPKLLTGILQTNLEKSFPLYFGNEFTVKTLGIIWHPVEDVYKIWVHLEDIEVYTKRNILSIISTIFDPLGFLGPVLVVAKLIIQTLWSKRNRSNKPLEWDDNISEEDKKIWIEFSTQLKDLSEISISRHIFGSSSQTRIELHGFSDASDKAYGAAIYIKSFNDDDIKIKLLCSRSRVSPLKKSTIPRLELCAAKLLAELLNLVKKAFADILNFDIIRLWTDSEIVLYWIYSHYGRWQPFVANRVKIIQDLSKESIWDYVHSKENPADVLSRGLSPSKLKDCKLWWNGPNWLQCKKIHQCEKNFKPSKIRPVEVRQSRNIFTCTTLIKKNIFFERFSSFNKLIRITAWCTRFCLNTHHNGPLIIETYLNTYEIQHATYTLIKVVQIEYFKDELKRLQNNICVAPKSRLISLAPFLDSMGIMRVGGRLRHAKLSYDHRFQILLPQNHIFSKLLVKYEHQRHFHAGPQFLKSILRRKYWILKIGNVIQNTILNCLPCIKQKADTKHQIMAVLPKNRVEPGRVFQTTGVDFAGPINLLRFKGDRRKTIIVAYISIFVCFSTKAIHLELVSDLTSEAFLAALARFISRRGIPYEIWSDNGTNFVGAKTKLDNISKLINNNIFIIQNFLSEKGCNWHFIPPRAPSFGGLWEAGVKSIKKHLKVTLGSTLLTYEQYETTLIQIEACVNSRPLITESSDPNEPGALTPGHFLIGGPITSLPNPDLTEVPSNRLKYWELVQQKTQEFWKRWSTEYLNTLQQRTKWKQNKHEIHINDVVIVKEDNIPPTQWPLGLITELHPGNDGIVRVVTIRMRVGNLDNTIKQRVIKMNELRRPVTKLIFLPTENELSNNLI